MGLAFSVFGAMINGVLAWFMLREGKQQRSITLQADAHHLFADVMTTVGVVVGVLLVTLTDWYILDPIVTLLVAANIIWTGIKLLRQTGLGLLDTVLPKEDLDVVNEVLDRYRAQGIDFHAVRTRMAARRRFVSFHVIVPGAWTVLKGHSLCEEMAQVGCSGASKIVAFYLSTTSAIKSNDTQAIDRRDIGMRTSNRSTSLWLRRRTKSTCGCIDHWS